MRFILVLLLFLPVSLVFGQNTERSETQKRLDTLKEQIARDEQKLEATSEAEKASIKTLKNLNRQIALREELVRNYQARIDQLQHERDSLQTSLQGLEQTLTRLKSEYRSRATNAYKHGRMHDLALILAAESINQMLVRVRYLHRFTEQRRQQLDNINEASRVLEERRILLQEKVARNNLLLRAAESEQKKLSDQKEQRRRVIAELRRKRVSLEEQITQNRSLAQQLQSRIAALIAKEASRRERVASASDNAAFSKLTGSFRQNFGNFPWPSQGTVIETFGNQIHPVYGTTTPNPGIFIATEPMAEIHTIFDGTVSTIDFMPDIGRYMIIEHGEYHTVYGNFSIINIGDGQKVKAGELIGRSGTEAEPKGEGVFFGIFKNGKPVDPIPWLRKR